MSFNKKTLDAVDVSGKRVFVRVDFNVPQDEAGAITDDRRIRAALPTIDALLRKGARLILASHLGRPKGQVNAKYSLRPVADRLSRILGKPVTLASDCIGSDVEQTVEALEPGGVVLLENLRFHAEEEGNDPGFSASLARLCDVYVNDAFGAAHRAHASTAGMAQVLKSEGKPVVAGYLMKKELEYLGGALENPARPFVAILGGAKVKDKIAVIESLLPKVDSLIIGGGMAYTFFKAKGYEIGNSLLDASNVEFAKNLLASNGSKVELPVDVMAVNGNPFDGDPNALEGRVVPVDQIPVNWEGVDIGPQTIKHFGDIVKSAKTVIWNGPMGIFEMDRFAVGTRGVADALTECSGTTIVGGGDSAAAVEKFGLADKITHISTGGGASLEFLEGKVLPGVDVLQDA